jgi:hypothetical protein
MCVCLCVCKDRENEGQTDRKKERMPSLQSIYSNFGIIRCYYQRKLTTEQYVRRLHKCMNSLYGGESLQTILEAGYHNQLNFFSLIYQTVSHLTFRYLIHLELVLVKTRNWNLVRVFCKWIPSFPRTICWRGCLFSNAYFGLLCQKSDGCSCMGLCLFCSIVLHAFLCMLAPCCFYY